jgi:hypothetical protein
VNELSLEITHLDSPEVAALKQTVLNLKRGNRNIGGSQTAVRAKFNRDNSNLVCFYCHKKGHIANECRGKIADESRGIRQKARPKPAEATSNDQVNEVTQGSQLKALTWEATKDTASLNY